MNGKIYVTRFGYRYTTSVFDTDCDATAYAKNKSAKNTNMNVLFMVRVPNYIDGHARYFFYMNGRFIGDNDCPLISEEDLYRFKI